MGIIIITYIVYDTCTDTQTWEHAQARHTWSVSFSRLGISVSGSAFYNFHKLGVPDQALGGIPLGFGIVVEDKISCMDTHTHTHTHHAQFTHTCDRLYCRRLDNKFEASTSKFSSTRVDLMNSTINLTTSKKWLSRTTRQCIQRELTHAHTNWHASIDQSTLLCLATK